VKEDILRRWRRRIVTEEMLEAIRAHDAPPSGNEPNPDELLTVEQVAHVFKVIPDTVRVWIQSGAPRASRPGNGMRPGRKYRVRRADLDAFVAASEGRVAPHDDLAGSPPCSVGKADG